MSDSTREKILVLFERHRKTPGTLFDESHFLDYLIHAPKGKGVVRDSFSGLRRFNRFIDEIQLEFGVYFSFADRGRNYSLIAFIERIIELQRSPKSSIASLRHEIKRGHGWNSVLYVNLILLALVFPAFKSPVLISIVGLLAVGFNVYIALSYLYSRTYNQRLLEKLQGE